MILRRVLALIWLLLMIYVLKGAKVFAQDVATGGIHGVVQDVSGARVTSVAVVVTDQATGIARSTVTDEQGEFKVRLLQPGTYRLRFEAREMSTLEAEAVVIELGEESTLTVTMRVTGASESVTVNGTAPEVKTQSRENAEIIDQKSIADLPVNGRRFADLALLVPGVVQDPRGMTSTTTGDLSAGGIRGYQSSYLVDGADNNNSFYAQARGRYRAPYQFSNEVVQEFRVNKNNYSTELGRAGAAVINVVTRSGSNELHGKTFYFLRDSRFGAQPGFLDFKPDDRQHQFGATIGGPLRTNRAFFFAGWDQHLFRVPTVVRFGDGAPAVTPTPDDYEASDQALVYLAANQLNQFSGTYESRLIGNAGFAKVDLVLSPTNLLTARVNSSRYTGDNNVFFDPASPITNYAQSENGTEDVSTISAVVSLTSGISRATTNSLRMQLSRDWQESEPNATYARTQVDGIIQGFGRSLILPRKAQERKLHLTDSISFDTRRHAVKFGGDMVMTKIYNYFPLQFGGGYIFDTIRVNPFTFVPEPYGMQITPLRAYAHMVPRYYMQNFGESQSAPDTNEYSYFAQDSIRWHDLGVTLGLRYDLQRFRTDRLISNPLWLGSGRVPNDTNNVAPRIGFAYALGGEQPLMIRGGWGLFYTRIPSIYTSAVEKENGLTRTHLFLDNADYYDRQVFPTYPDAVAFCEPAATSCATPATVAGNLTSEISAFSSRFQMPVVQQGSVSLEREVSEGMFLSASYLYTHGEHLIRARDANLPSPERVSYPVFDETGNTFLGYYDVDSFTQWEMSNTLSCTFPPCVGDLSRPIPQLGSINVFESAATSIYHSATISVKRAMSKGLFFRIAYTWGQAVDDGQDALVVSRPALVQNSYQPKSERAWSSVDQRQRWVAAWTWEPRAGSSSDFNNSLLKHWKFSGVMTYGSGRPVNARVAGDANRDGNSDNDRLPGYSRNAFLGPDYMTSDLRVSKTFRVSRRVRFELMSEIFNMFNRDNKRVNSSDDGFDTSAAKFVQQDTVLYSRHFPAQYRKLDGFLRPSASYAPRQVQFALRFYF